VTALSVCRLLIIGSLAESCIYSSTISFSIHQNVMWAAMCKKNDVLKNKCHLCVTVHRELNFFLPS
jgi:hypothetical protein